MSASPEVPKSPTLLPPHKGTEIEDSGAHELSGSEAEDDDVFSDAQEDRASNAAPSSPIPMTRVEKVDDRESHGEVPGTPAWKLRTQDAVPDEVEVVPEGHARSRASSHMERSETPGGTPIPRTIVDKVDPTSPSHGDVPGTTAHTKRQADAIPDIIRPASDHSTEANAAEAASRTPVPRTMITRVDSKPSHGEVPGTEAYDLRKGDARPDVVERKADKPSESQFSRPQLNGQHTESISPIAADGGFGPMGSDESEEDSTEADVSSIEKHEREHEHAAEEAENAFGDEFDDFEEGDDDEDFGEFDEMPNQKSIPQIADAVPVSTFDIPFPLLDFSDMDTLDEIIAATNPYLDEIFPSTKDTHIDPSPSQTASTSLFLSDRSLSLWTQLVAPPPLQPPNWVRSRIRRLFLVSLGVPVDLDEILPASKQKKLILPSMHLRNGSPSPVEGQRTGSRVRLKQDNASSTSIDKAGTSSKGKRRKGPPPPPELDLQDTRMICATTIEAISNMTDEELLAHCRKLEDLTTRASEVLEYWLKRRDSALGDKEAFEGVIENLVKHARRVRK